MGSCKVTIKVAIRSITHCLFYILKDPDERKKNRNQCSFLVMFKVTEFKGSSLFIFFLFLRCLYLPSGSMRRKKIFINLIVIAFLLSLGDLIKGTELGFHKQYQPQESWLRGIMLCEGQNALILRIKQVCPRTGIG